MSLRELLFNVLNLSAQMAVLVIDVGQRVRALGVRILARVLATLTLHPGEGSAQDFDSWLWKVLQRQWEMHLF